MISNYFLTGATGTIGSSIVPMLLEDTSTNIYLLIRASNDQELQQRFNKLCEFWEIGAEDHKRIRLTPIRGDLSELDLGLSKENIHLLKNKITQMIHAAGNVRMNLAMDDAIKESVGVTKNILSFSKTCRSLKKIEFISTIGIVGKMQKNIKEDRMIHNEGFHNNYEAAKYEAEKTIWEEIDAGLPITIHRPSMVIGDSKTGKILHFQIFYFLMEFLKGEKTFGFLPNFKKFKIDVVPVDFVSRAIVLSSRDERMIGKVLHLCSGDAAVPLTDLVSIANKDSNSVKKIKFIPTFYFNFAIKLFKFILSKNKFKKFTALPFFMVYLERNQIFNNQNTLNYLRSHNLILQSFADYNPILLSYFKSNK